MKTAQSHNQQLTGLIQFFPYDNKREWIEQELKKMKCLEISESSSEKIKKFKVRVDKHK